MQKFFGRVDDTLIDSAFQPLVDWVADHLRLTCFQQARACTHVAAVVWILSQMGDLVAAVRLGAPVLQAIQAGLLLLGLAAIMVLHTLFQRFGGVTDRINPLRAGMYPHRLVTLLGLTINVAQAITGAGSLAGLSLGLVVTVAVYMAACSNPPPRRREGRNAAWGRGLLTLSGLPADPLVPGTASGRPNGRAVRQH